MAFDTCRHVWHATIAYFDCTPVEDFAELRTSREMLGNEGEKPATNVGFNATTIGRVKPYYVIIIIIITSCFTRAIPTDIIVFLRGYPRYLDKSERNRPAAAVVRISAGRAFQRSAAKKDNDESPYRVETEGRASPKVFCERVTEFVQ